MQRSGDTSMRFFRLSHAVVQDSEVRLRHRCLMAVPWHRLNQRQRRLQVTGSPGKLSQFLTGQSQIVMHAGIGVRLPVSQFLMDV